MPRRCVFGCPPIFKTITHRFPHPVRNPEVFKAWVDLVGGELKTPKDYEYYANKIVCDIHFTHKDKNRNNRLNSKAVPTILVDGAKVRTPTPSKDVNAHSWHQPEKKNQSVIDCPASEAIEYMKVEHNYSSEFSKSM